MVEKLKQYPVLTDDSQAAAFFKSLVRDQAMHELGVGTMRSMNSIETGVVLPIMSCRAYTLREKATLWVSKIAFIKKTPLADQLFAADVTTSVTRLEIPVYFFSGAYDLTVNYGLSKAYLTQIDSPVKGFYTFEHSAHSPIFEEPEKMMRLLRKDVLRGETNLADKE
ncbi:MAG: alpha/beta hydrolase [Bacillota bacterium]|nr:alpha/beta hydrolase [Bacillota bacterium]